MKYLINLKFATLITLGLLLFLSINNVYAVEYVLSEPIPGSGLPPVLTGTQIFATYVGGLMRFLVAFAALAATVMIVIWGVIYMGSAGSESTLKNAREGITSAILGLLLALLSYLVLYTINPDLVNLQISIPEVPRTSTVSQPSTPRTPQPSSPSTPIIPTPPNVVP